MADYLHGAYGQIKTAGSKVAAKSRSAIVYFGTAPVHTVEGGAANVNKPILVANFAEARRKLGYSDDWAKYSLCEAMHVHFEQKGIGPLVFINVLDPAKHKAAEAGSASMKPVNGRISITNAEDIIFDSVKIEGKVKGVDYSMTYDYKKKMIVIAGVTSKSLGDEALSISWDLVDASAVQIADLIGASDGEGLNTGLYAIKNVYQETGYIPAYMLAPGFSQIPEVHKAMYENSVKVNGHWNVYMMVDIPVVAEDGSAITLSTAHTWKSANGYNMENEKPYFPLIQGTDGKKYHISVLSAANFQELLAAQDGIPYKTSSNTECEIIQNLYMGEDSLGRVFDDTLINETLNKNGIASAAYVGGRWVIWGCHNADYDQENADYINVFETNRMMLFYVCNDFQHRRARDVDKPLTANDIKSIVAEEQARLDALIKIGALTFGEIYINASEIPRSDLMNGDYAFTFNISTTPLAKSLTADVYWTDEGYNTYFAELG